MSKYQESALYHWHLPLPVDQLGELLPAPFVAAYRQAIELKAALNEAGSKLAQAKAALDQAEADDITALATAITEGKSDPGRSAVAAADAAVRAAQRSYEATDEAGWAAVQKMAGLLSTIDRKAVCAKLEAEAETERQRCLAAVAEAHEARRRFEELRLGSLSISAAPGYPGLLRGQADWHQLRALIERDLATLSLPMPAALGEQNPEPSAADRELAGRPFRGQPKAAA